MTTSSRWSLGLVLGLLFIAACGGDPPPPPPPPPMAVTVHDVTISSAGSFSPRDIAPNPNDVVVFLADGADVVLCVDTSAVFGDTRYPIANGTRDSLTVQPGAERIPFAYVAVVGDSEADCDGSKGEEGGGTTGPP